VKFRWIALLVLAGVAASGAAGAAWVISAPRPAFHAKDEAVLASGDAGRGKAVFDAGACASCHASPGQPNRLVLGGGMALTSPFGTFYPPNISQDRADGIGSWRAIDIANAVMSGVSPKGNHYYPALPYVNYAKMRREDMADLIAYLRTLPAIPGGTPAHDLPAPFKIRRAIGFWKALYFEQGTMRPDPAHDAAWNRGRYLVDALSHCGECHSAHNVLDAVKEKARYAGGIDQSGVGFVPNITPAGIGRWSLQEIVASLTTGETPEGRKLAGSMADMVLNTAALPEPDRAAMAAYLKSLPPRRSPEAVKAR
jgi:mono/diheme cytochrome c family protein